MDQTLNSSQDKQQKIPDQSQQNIQIEHKQLQSQQVIRQEKVTSQAFKSLKQFLSKSFNIKYRPSTRNLQRLEQLPTQNGFIPFLHERDDMNNLIGSRENLHRSNRSFVIEKAIKMDDTRSQVMRSNTPLLNQNKLYFNRQTNRSVLSRINKIRENYPTCGNYEQNSEVREVTTGSSMFKSRAEKLSYFNKTYTYREEYLSTEKGLQLTKPRIIGHPLWNKSIRAFQMKEHTLSNTETNHQIRLLFRNVGVKNISQNYKIKIKSGFVGLPSERIEHERQVQSHKKNIKVKFDGLKKNINGIRNLYTSRALFKPLRSNL